MIFSNYIKSHKVKKLDISLAADGREIKRAV